MRVFLICKKKYSGGKSADSAVLISSTSSQWATIAVEADGIITKLREEAKQRMSDGGKGKQLIATLPTDAKVAELFNTKNI